MTLVREDNKVLYVVIDTMVCRPREVSGYSHVYNMTDGGLKKAIKSKGIVKSVLVWLTLL